MANTLELMTYTGEWIGTLVEGLRRWYWLRAWGDWTWVDV